MSSPSPFKRPPFKRPPFWLGLLLGGLTSFGAWRLRQPPRSRTLDPLFDLVSDAVIFSDASGAISDMNAAARALFGPDGAGLAGLCYPSGQPIPLGQSPVRRVLLSGKEVEGAGYLCVSAAGKPRVLDIKGGPLPGGGTVLTARDMTEVEEGQSRERKTWGREEVLRALCRRLSAAPDAEGLAQAVVESALSLAEGLPGVRARLYAYDSDLKRLTRLASAPDDRPKRPRSHRQAQRPTFPFDASSPLLWSVYVAREPVMGDDLEGRAYAVPLITEGAAVGHLSVTHPSADAFADGGLSDALALLASVASLALAGPRQASQTAALAAQVEALQAVIRAVAEGIGQGPLADLVSGEVCRATGAEVCTLALEEGDGLRLVGTAYRDTLLLPDRHAPDDPALVGDAARKAVRTGKTARQAGLANPPFEAGVWRAFAGQSGRHSVLSVPLAAGRGALTVYAAGDAPFPDAQVRFLETLAALVSVTLPGAS